MLQVHGNGCWRPGRTLFVAFETGRLSEQGAQHKTVAESLMTSDGLQPLVQALVPSLVHNCQQLFLSKSRRQKVDAITSPDIRKASLAAEAHGGPAAAKKPLTEGDLRCPCTDDTSRAQRLSWQPISQPGRLTDDPG